MLVAGHRWGSIGAMALDVAFAVLIVVNGIVILVRDYLLDPPYLDSWQVAEMLINYAGGPVRRGLLGEALRMSYARGHHVDIYVLIFGISLAAWLLSCVLLWYQTRRADVITRVVLLFSPMLLAFPLNDPDGFGRKDSLSLIYVSCSLLTLSMNQRAGRYAFVILAVVGLPALVATHEAAMLFCAPATILLYLVHVTRHETPSIGAIMARVCALLAPAIIAFGFAMARPGNPEQAMQICLAAAQQYPRLTCEPLPSPMASFSTAAQDSYGAEIRETWRTPAIYWSLAGTLVYLSCLFLTARAALHSRAAVGSSVHWRVAFVVGAFVVLPTIPLYVVGADYGRWLSVAALTAVLILTNRHVMIPAATWTQATSTAKAFEAPVRLLTVAAAVLTPFVFLSHYPPAFLVMRTISDKTLGLADFSAFVLNMVAH